MINIPVPQARIADFCQRHHIQRLSLFGSVLRADFAEDSDIDVLVEFDPHHTPDFFTLYEMEQELSGVFGGRHVDLLTPKSLNRRILERALTSAEVQYEQG